MHACNVYLLYISIWPFSQRIIIGAVNMACSAFPVIVRMSVLVLFSQVAGSTKVRRPMKIIPGIGCGLNTAVHMISSLPKDLTSLRDFGCGILTREEDYLKVQEIIEGKTK